MKSTRAHIASPRNDDAVATRVRLLLLLLGGLLLRLFFLPNEGFKVDINSFEAWALTLAAHPFWQFYGSTSFADYPPGYFYILALVGHLYAPVAAHGGDYTVLKVLVKLPAITMDLFDGYVLFVLVRRYAGEGWGLAAAAAFLFNPATIFISAAWGQVDSVAGGLALLGLYLLVRGEDREARSFNWEIVCAWLALAYSLLIKPQAAILVPLFIAFAFVDRQRRAQRSIATAAGILGALLLALALTLPFHPTANPAAAFAWLYDKYEFGKNVYPYNSINAFNLWTIRYDFWQPDGTRVAGLPMYLWGLILLSAAAVLTLVRYVQLRTTAALIESAALLTLAFYVFSTRMHERYIFDGLTFTIACIPFARRYLWAAFVLSTTLLVNLFYSLYYLRAVTHHTPGVNPYDMAPLIVHPLSFVNALVFFALGYAFLGQADAAPHVEPQIEPAAQVPVRARNWFDPAEGLQHMVWPLDYLLAGAVGLFAFVLSFVDYWKPGGKIFDEIYFARAAEEYLTHKYIYENTHPPLTKLIITLSTMLFGGMHGGDNAHGWRFLDVVCGAIVVVILYAFAKRITRSPLFATFAALLLTFDGMHFVQSRIATPEGIVVVFSLATLYAFYRYWLASQATVRAYEPRLRSMRIALSAGIALVAGFALSALLNVALTRQSTAAVVVCGVYFAVGFYLVLRLWVIARLLGTDGTFASYPEGSFAVRGGADATLYTVDGGKIGTRQKTPVLGWLTRVEKGALQLDDGEASLRYGRDLSVRYETPAGGATYTPGRVAADSGETQDGAHATGWLVAFTVLLGLLVASKWYGVMAYGVSFVVIFGVWLQRYLRVRRPKLWGNPFGFRLDVAIAAIVFISATVYAMVWIPDAIRQIEIKNVSDLVYRQYTMFEYHDTLKATHPYQSVWWQWPLDLRPIAYYYQDLRHGISANDTGGCCVAEIISLPNPLILWFGLLCVPIVGVLGWRERNKGYALLVLAYLLQWLPWMRSPRITFAYHFYVDIPLICLCNVIVLQRIWEWGRFNKDAALFARIGVVAYVAAVALAFAWFYPILAGVPIPWNQWDARMWHALMGNAWV